MKFSLHIDREREEECIIFARENRPVFEQIAQLLRGGSAPLVGYHEEDIVVLPLEDVVCFVSEGDRVFARMGSARYLVKKRLYQLAELLKGDYIRINQSCIANIRQISRFTVSFGGSLQVVFKNGDRDFVSRRELKKVKERIGIL